MSIFCKYILGSSSGDTGRPQLEARLLIGHGFQSARFPGLERECLEYGARAVDDELHAFGGLPAWFPRARLLVEVGELTGNWRRAWRGS